MRVLRWTALLLTVLLVALCGVVWSNGNAVVSYTVVEATSIQFLGRRMYLLEVRSGWEMLGRTRLWWEGGGRWAWGGTGHIPPAPGSPQSPCAV
jgi:hypothetical protein